jgi:protein required for attachment to host cells
MHVPHDTLVAIADGEHLHLFKSSGEGEDIELKALERPKIEGSNHSGGAHHHSSAANPDKKGDAHDMFAAASADYLNKLAIGNKIEHAIIVAAPRLLGEMRKHYHKALDGKLLKEIPKDLTGQTSEVIKKTLHAA